MDFTAFVVLSIVPFPEICSLAVELLSAVLWGKICQSVWGVDSLTHRQTGVQPVSYSVDTGLVFP